MQFILTVVSLLLILSVFLSLIRNDYWIFKICEYPRLQKLVLITALLLAWLLFLPTNNLANQLIPAALFLSAVYLIYKIWPYTPFSKKEMVRVHATGKQNEFKVFSANVLQENTEFNTMLAQIRSVDPDIIFLLETNQVWADAMADLQKGYPHKLLCPLENTYGLLFYSRFKLEKERILFRVKKDVPSIEALVKLPSGKKFQLYGMHPEPPVPGESLRSTAKDKELMKVAFQINERKLPCLVIGDLNDVAWSYTTELFRKTSELLDPRRGRGFYNTFSAHHWFIRFPLDYVFCSEEFGLIGMKRMPKNGSDHFATLTHLALREELKHKQEATKADEKELKDARELANH